MWFEPNVSERMYTRMYACALFVCVGQFNSGENNNNSSFRLDIPGKFLALKLLLLRIYYLIIVMFYSYIYIT